MEKSFGLKQARAVLSKVPDFHPQTLQACLIALGVSNVVNEEVKAETARGQEVVRHNREKARAVAKSDGQDDLAVETKINRLRAERSKRRVQHDKQVAELRRNSQAELDRITDLEGVVEAFSSRS